MGDGRRNRERRMTERREMKRIMENEDEDEDQEEEGMLGPRRECNMDVGVKKHLKSTGGDMAQRRRRDRSAVAEMDQLVREVRLVRWPAHELCVGESR